MLSLELIVCCTTIGQPLADAMHYQNHDVIKILEKHGSNHKVLCCIFITLACSGVPAFLYNNKYPLPFF